MANNNRERGRFASDKNWDPYQGRSNRPNKYDQVNYGRVDYDRDNDRERDWELQSRRNRSNYGSSDYQSNYGGSDFARNREDDNIQDVGRQDFRDQSEDSWKRNNMNSGSYSSDYGYQGEGPDYGQPYHSSGGYYNREEYQGGNTGRQQSPDRTRNMYGGDTSNYGNANQGGFDRDWWEKTRDEVSSWFGNDNAERRRRMDRINGPHRGKGPKGYHRSDERIEEDVCDRLSDNPVIDASDIEVKVQGSEVILTGTVETREDKRRAEDLAESVSGVINVQNQLRVGHPEQRLTNRGSSMNRNEGRSE